MRSSNMPVQEESSILELREILAYCADLIRAGEGHNNPVRVDTMLERLAQLGYIKFNVQNHVLTNVAVLYRPGESEIPSYDDTIDYYRQLIISLANKIRRTPDTLTINDIKEKEEIIQCYDPQTKSLKIPEGIIKIGDSVFRDSDYNTYFSNIILPDTIVEIGKMAFQNYSGHINFPNSLIKINDSAFTHYSFDITLPDSVIEIGSYALSLNNPDMHIILSNNLQSVNQSIKIPNSLHTNVKNNIRYLGSNENQYLLLIQPVTKQTSGSIVSTCKIIQDFAFQKNSIINVTIPSSVSFIGQCAFDQCTQLSSVTFPDNPTSLTNLSDGMFQKCSNLNRIVIPDYITQIGKYIFRDCTNLSNITLSNNLTEIPEYAFSNCTSLTSITLPSGITKIGERAFENCSNLTSIIIPDTVVEIGISAFYGCSRLTSITIPNSVIKIGSHAFEGCTNLTSFPNGLGNNILDMSIWDFSNVPTVTYGACQYLGDYEILTKCQIYTSTNITIHENCKAILAEAFRGTAVRTITMSNNIKQIYKQAFHHCIDLTNITLPETLIYIGDQAFYDCQRVQCTSLPTDIIIGNEAFGASGSTKKCQTSSWASGICYLPNNLNQNYYKLVSWDNSTLGKDVTISNIASTCTEICAGAFYQCTKMTAV